MNLRAHCRYRIKYPAARRPPSAPSPPPASPPTDDLPRFVACYIKYLRCMRRVLISKRNRSSRERHSTMRIAFPSFPSLSLSLSRPPPLLCSLLGFVWGLCIPAALALPRPLPAHTWSNCRVSCAAFRPLFCVPYQCCPSPSSSYTTPSLFLHHQPPPSHCFPSSMLAKLRQEF